MKQRSFRIIFNTVLCAVALQLVGCSTVPKVAPNAQPPIRQFHAEEGKVYLLEVKDPMEGWNRGVYKFNYQFDKYLFIPVVKSYEFVMPNYAEDRVSSFFNNIREFKYFYNNLLQLKLKSTATTVGRFAVNTTVGLVGLYDPATHWGMERKPEDLGQTLGHYGVGKGAFSIIPIIGPSNTRDGVGFIGDIVVNSQVGPITWIDDDEIEMGLNALNAVDMRHKVKFRYGETGSPFEYDLIRMFYTMKREMDIKQ